MKKQFYLYILTNQSNSVLYIGSTSNLIGRIYTHKNLNGSKFASRYRVTKLVYYEMSDDMEAILYREIQVKRWHRKWKVRMVNKFNPTWEDLYPNII